MLRELMRLILYLLFRLLTHLQVTGMEHIPPAGACIVAGNHLGILDGPLLFALVPRKDLTALVAKKHQRNPIFRLVVNIAGGIWLDRFILEVKPVQQVQEHLKKGGLLGIAPEGTRSRTHHLMKAKNGVAFLVGKGDVPIIPEATTGTEDAVPKLLRLRRPKITVRFGPSFRLAPIDIQDRSGSRQRNTDDIMCHIAALLPEQYRGVYTDHPRLRELVDAGYGTLVSS
jgi:1-acyl-sn-glycerol-3-phosphate acyltransferase